MRHFTPKLSGSTVVSGSFTSDTHLIPKANGVYDIGSASMGWRNLYGTASVAISASFATTSTSASYASTVEYNNITNVPEGIVSSSTQVINHLPDGTVSSSVQIDYTNITNVPGGIVSSSTQVINNLPDGTVSGSSQINYTNVTNIPLGIISSSTQINNLISDGGVLPDGTLSSSAQIASDISGALSAVAIAELGANILSGSITTSSITNFNTHVSSAAASAGFGTGGGGGGSYTLTNTDIAGLGVGIISGSSQLPDGTVSSSVQIDYTNITNVPRGIVSSSTQISSLLPDGVLSGSEQLPDGLISGSSQIKYRYILGASGANHYTFTGNGLTGAENDPEIFLYRGFKYEFVNSSGGHPFQLQTTVNGAVGSPYQDGVSGAGGDYIASNGETLTIDVQFDAPDTLYYQCTSHNSMGGKINIINVGGGVSDTGSFYISSSVNLNTITFTQGDGTTETIIVDTGSSAAFSTDGTGILSSSAQISTQISGTLSAVAIAELGANILSGSITTSSITNFNTHVSSAAASAGFGTGGGGGSYTLTNTDIAGLGVDIVSSSAQTTANLPVGVISGSSQIDFGVANGVVPSGDGAGGFNNSGIATATNVIYIGKDRLAFGASQDGEGAIDAGARASLDPNRLTLAAVTNESSTNGIRITDSSTAGASTLTISSEDGVQITGSVDINSILGIPGFPNVSASLAAISSSAVDGGGGSYTLTNTDIAGLGVGIVSSSAQISGLGFSSGSGGSGGFYVHTQSSAAVEWTVNHSLGEQFPNVTVYDENYEVIIPEEISASNSNNLVITLPTAETGWVAVGNGGSSGGGSYILTNTDIAGLGVGIISSSAQTIANLPDGLVSGSSQISYTNITNVPGGIVSSSTQVETIINNNNVLPDGTISSSAQISGLGFSSGSSGGSGGFYVHTQSSAAVEWIINHSLGEQFPNVTVYDENYEVIIPEEISASNSNNLVVTLPTAETGWVAVGNGGSSGGGSYTLTNTDIAGLGVGIISGSSQLPNGIHSSSAQVVASLDNQHVDFGTGNITASELTIAGTASANVFSGDGAAITGIISASHAVTASYAPSSYVLPDGVVSGSDQIVPLLPDGTISGSTQVSFTNITNVPDGIVSGSSQIENLSFTSSYTETAESASVVENVSASNADYLRMWVGPKADYDSISGSANDNTLYFLT